MEEEEDERKSSAVGQVSRLDQTRTDFSILGAGVGVEGVQGEVSPDAMLRSNSLLSKLGKGVVGDAGVCFGRRMGVVGGDAMVSTFAGQWSAMGSEFFR